LLDYGADVNAKDTELWTPLHAAGKYLQFFAFKKHETRAVIIFLKWISIVNQFKIHILLEISPFNINSFLACCGYATIVQLLINANADLVAVNAGKFYIGRKLTQFTKIL
jgi:hypothetical protein